MSRPTDSSRSAPLSAIVLANDYYLTGNGKTAHGLVRGSERFVVQAVVDPVCAGRDAGEALDGQRRDIPIVTDIDAALSNATSKVSHCVIGIATHGGHLTPELKTLILEAIDAGLNIVNGLHDCTCDDPRIAAAADRASVTLTDIRKPKPHSQLHEWEGSIHQVQAVRIAVLGTDCALGKRTTARLLTQALNTAGLRSEMIYTGQTGWMQGSRYGFILDSTANDYVSGELEHAIVQCDAECHPDVILLEGQSALRNPSGPCGAEFLLSGAAQGVVLQHCAARTHYEGFEELDQQIPSLASEIQLIELYGTPVLAVTLNEDQDEDSMQNCQRTLSNEFAFPVLRPLRDSLDPLLAIITELARRT